MRDIIKIIFETKTHRKVTQLAIVLGVLFIYIAQLFYANPTRKYNTQKRDIETVKNIVNSKENVEVILKSYSSEYVYKVDGTCGKNLVCEDGWCTSIGVEDYRVFKEMDVCKSYFRKEDYDADYLEIEMNVTYNGRVFTIQNYPYGEVVDLSLWYIKISPASYRSESTYGLVDRKISVYLQDEECYYDPNNVFGSTCFFDDRAKATSFLDFYYELLEVIGVSEPELIEYFEWCRAELKRNI